jgi:transposase-like protein
MSRACSVCARDDRAAIDEAVLAGASIRRIAAQFGVPASNLYRHAPQHLAAAAARVQDVRGLDVVKQLQAINAASLQVLREARASGDGRLVLQAVDRVQRQLELQARLLGDLAEPQTTVNVLNTGDWPVLRWRIVQALDAFPDARVSVLSALASADGQSNGRAH